MEKRKWNGHLPTIEERRKGALTAWASDVNAMLAGAKKGGHATGNTINTCPKCGRQVKGNSGFGQHKKKCMTVEDK